tara:strand:+ start:198 stop:305 length:108 start_codon:yes stop_codon:yes gene_type:complete
VKLKKPKVKKAKKPLSKKISKSEEEQLKPKIIFDL